MAQQSQQEREPYTAATNIEAEYEQLCRELRPDYAKFCKEQPGFRGGYAEYMEVMQMVQDEIRDRAELARLDQEQREIKGYFLYPPICLMPEKDRQELHRLFAEDADQDAADESRFPFLTNDSYKDLRAVIPKFEEREPGGDRGTRPVEEFVPSDNYRRCRWRDRPEYEFNKSQAHMVKALHEDFLRGGTGLSDAKLFAATKLRRRQKRAEHVFRNFKNRVWVTHPALTDGFLIHESGVWRLNLEKHKKHLE